MLDHDRVHRFADTRRVEPALLQLDIAVVFDRLDDRRVRRWATDTALLELANERRLGVARGRLAEMLLRLDPVVVEILAVRQLGKVGLAVLLTRPDLVEPIKRQHGTVGAEDVLATLDLDLRLVVDGRRHPAGHKAPPDEVVELELVGAQVLLDRIGGAVDVSGPDRLVGVLCARAGLDGPGRAGVLVAVLVIDPGLDAGLSLGRDARRVGSHVGDQTG